MPKIQESLRSIDAWISGFPPAFALNFELSASSFFVPATRIYTPNTKYQTLFDPQHVPSAMSYAFFLKYTTKLFPITGFSIFSTIRVQRGFFIISHTRNRW
jgi:hypothetical protein